MRVKSPLKNAFRPVLLRNNNRHLLSKHRVISTAIFRREVIIGNSLSLPNHRMNRPPKDERFILNVRRQDGEIFMPQNSETGRQGYETGYKNADEIGALLGAIRLSNDSNEFRWNGRIVVIKTGSSAVVTRATLGRVTAIVYGEETDNGWTLYEIAAKIFEKLSVQSHSRKHDENYRLVRRKQIRETGRRIPVEA